MHLGRGRSLWWAGVLASTFGVAAGCVSNRTQIDQALLAQRPPAAYFQQIANAYHARCPDMLAMEIAGLPQYSGSHRIGPDGRIDLGDAGQPRVDGGTTPEIARVIAEHLSVSPEQVRVTVTEYNSQYLYLYGQVAGLQRAVPYQGPETVLDLLHRVGGVAPGATVRDIKVVRPHVADGKVPEVFRVDLTAIVVRKDSETNIILQPCDQIYIGQSHRSSFGDCLPPWLRPVYQRLCGMKRESERPAPAGWSGPTG